jgi:hypothetical protein
LSVFSIILVTGDRKMAGQNQRRTRLRIESLERRLMLAGDVTVDLIRGDLIIRGDELDNSITIEPGAEEGQYVVTGNDTTVHGGDEPIVVEDDVLIFMGDGADVVVLDGSGGDSGLVVPDDLRIITGAGDDEVLLQDVTVGDDLLILTSRGGDTVTLTDATVGDDAIISTSADNDVVLIENSTIEDDLRIGTGTGDDELLIVDSTIGDDATLNTWQGDDTVAIGIDGENVVRPVRVEDRLMLSTGMGSDTVRIVSLTVSQPGEKETALDRPDFLRRLFHETIIYTGDDDDSVELLDSVLAGGLQLNLGRGDDLLTATGNEVLESTLLIGGQGEDAANEDIADDGVNEFANLRMLGFEVPPPADPDPGAPPRGGSWRDRLSGLFGWLAGFFDRR